MFSISNVYPWYFKFSKSNCQDLFSLGTDDGHHVVLESISEGVDCEHDYINATYIDVRFLKFYTWLLKRSPTRFTS